MNNDTPPYPLAALKKMFESLLDHDLYDMKSLAEWCQRPYETQRAFKQQLLACIHQPGMLSVDTFEQWTNVAVDDQDDLQQRLKSVWNTCYPGEKLS